MFSVCLVATPDATWEKQWSYLLSNFKPEKLYVIGDIDTSVIPFRSAILIENAEAIEELLVLLIPENGRNVQGQESILTFQHPEECCYMFGADNRFMDEDQLGARDPDHKVFIPTDTHDAMYSFIAGSVALYDRRVKCG